ncbi:hypothetical protein CEXT_246561 [Caerostris extrusa]|uniref:Uncharacterized protein n=1 Tax=Caerostris extrusa TaxID=172846 RepID=A0AAV4URA4_CAEEX|nr:hypothetical protein CEXT_246561 [Caerostris extrusa]
MFTQEIPSTLYHLRNAPDFNSDAIIKSRRGRFRTVQLRLSDTGSGMKVIPTPERQNCFDFGQLGVKTGATSHDSCNGAGRTN